MLRAHLIRARARGAHAYSLLTCALLRSLGVAPPPVGRAAARAHRGAVFVGRQRVRGGLRARATVGLVHRRALRRARGPGRSLAVERHGARRRGVAQNEPTREARARAAAPGGRRAAARGRLRRRSSSRGRHAAPHCRRALDHAAAAAASPARRPRAGGRPSPVIPASAPPQPRAREAAPFSIKSHVYINPIKTSSRALVRNRCHTRPSY